MRDATQGACGAFSACNVRRSARSTRSTRSTCCTSMRNWSKGLKRFLPMITQLIESDGARLVRVERNKDLHEHRLGSAVAKCLLHALAEFEIVDCGARRDGKVRIRWQGRGRDGKVEGEMAVEGASVSRLCHKRHQRGSREQQSSNNARVLSRVRTYC